MAIDGYIIVDGNTYKGQFRSGGDTCTGGYLMCLVLFEGYRVFGDDKFQVSCVKDNGEYLDLKMEYGVVPKSKRLFCDRAKYDNIRFYRKK